MNIINRTPHEITLVREDGTSVAFPPSGNVLRLVEYDTDPPGSLECGLPITCRSWRTPTDEPPEGAVWIVSLPMLQAMAQHPRVVAPDTGAGAVRDDAGRIIGVTGFITRRPVREVKIVEYLEEDASGMPCMTAMIGGDFHSRTPFASKAESRKALHQGLPPGDWLRIVDRRWAGQTAVEWTVEMEDGA